MVKLNSYLRCSHEFNNRTNAGNCGWAPEGCDAYETDTHVFDLDDLRAAIADHDRIDTCTDIKNHISPNTKVIEHE